MENKIILEAQAKLQDNELREWVSKLCTRIETLNDRTKSHTIQIRDLIKEIKELKKQNGKGS
jgi:chaperonin cofactor prefoldin